MSEPTKVSLGRQLVDYFQKAVAAYGHEANGKTSPLATSAWVDFTEKAEVIKDALTGAKFNAKQADALCKAIDGLALKAAKRGGDFKEAAFFEQALKQVAGPEDINHVLIQANELQKGIDLKVLTETRAKIPGLTEAAPPTQVTKPKHEGFIGTLLEHKYKVGAGVAALAVGAWALGEANKRNEAENQPKQI